MTPDKGSCRGVMSPATNHQESGESRSLENVRVLLAALDCMVAEGMIAMSDVEVKYAHRHGKTTK